METSWVLAQPATERIMCGVAVPSSNHVSALPAAAAAAGLQERAVRDHDNISVALESLQSRWKAARLPVAWLPERLAALKRASLQLVASHITATLSMITPEVEQIEQQSMPGYQPPKPGAGKTCAGQLQLGSPGVAGKLKEAVGFVFRAHQFVGGFDARCEGLAQQLLELVARAAVE
jgi:hypothetical protein